VVHFKETDCENKTTKFKSSSSGLLGRESLTPCKTTEVCDGLNFSSRIRDREIRKYQNQMSAYSETVCQPWSTRIRGESPNSTTGQTICITRLTFPQGALVTQQMSLLEHGAQLTYPILSHVTLSCSPNLKSPWEVLTSNHFKTFRALGRQDWKSFPEMISKNVPVFGRDF